MSSEEYISSDESLAKDLLYKNRKEKFTSDAGTLRQRQPAPARLARQSNSPILKLRLKLCDELHFLRANDELSSDREYKNKCFHKLYEIISTLLMNGHFASFIEHRYESLIIASIDPNDPSKDAEDNWHVVIEDSIAKYLDVKGQFLFPENLFRDETRTKCSSRERDENTNMTIRSACFQGSRLIFSKEIAKCTDTKNIIYGFRCKRCPPGSAASNISYVGQTGEGVAGKRSVHDRHTEHHKKILNQEQLHLPMYKHVARDPHTSNFPNTIEMIYLPITSSKYYYNCLNSWECFWQFFCRARDLRGGWCKDFPPDPVRAAKAAEKAKNGIKVEENAESEQEASDMACKKNIKTRYHGNNFVAEPAAPKMYEQTDKKGYQTKVCAADTHILSSSTTNKHRTFVYEPMGDKPVTCLAGVGPATAKRLEEKGYDKANKVLRKFLELKKDKVLFTKWLKDTAGANVKRADDCYQCLSVWCTNDFL